MPTLQIQNVGQIEEANLSFGDLTILVGPQATGKSISLQLLKLVIDAGQIQNEMKRYGLEWSGDLARFLNVYLGEGMHSIWNQNDSTITWEDKEIDLRQYASRMRKDKDEELFLIPAQRVLTLHDGWPRPFSDYSATDPFVVRRFSDELRLLMDSFKRQGDDLFPQPRRLKRELRELLEQNVFGTFHLKVDSSVQKRLMLATDSGALPYMVWSAGQREFVPLLLGLYWLMPPSKVKMRGNVKWVVIEELEMGLHPRAISAVLLLVFDLVTRGYRVCLSTHSPQILDAIWAMKFIAANGSDPGALLRVFEAERSGTMKWLAGQMMKKEVKVFYFGRNGKTTDISELDAASDNLDEADWGGLTEFSSRANMEVANAVVKSMKHTK